MRFSRSVLCNRKTKTSWHCLNNSRAAKSVLTQAPMVTEHIHDAFAPSPLIDKACTWSGFKKTGYGKYVLGDATILVANINNSEINASITNPLTLICLEENFLFVRLNTIPTPLDSFAQILASKTKN